MPQLNTLVLKDRAATPVDHTFLPRSITDGVGAVVESTGVPIGERQFTIGMKKTATGRYKATIRLVVPTVVTEVIGEVSRPRVERTAYADATFSFDGSSSEQERKDLIGMFQSALDTSKWTNDVVVNLQSVY